MTTVSLPTDPVLAQMLARHEGVTVSKDANGPVLRIDQDGWSRTLTVGDANADAAGLVELMDNNPIVCADSMSVPGPAATLALVSLGPLVRAGILVETPVMQVAGCNVEDGVEAYLAMEGWNEGVFASEGDEDLKGVVAANCVAMVQAQNGLGEIVELFRECYGRSFYVREHTDGEWDTSLVSGRPFALYSLGFTQGEGSSLVTVRTMADRNGKCGAAQVVHALNVMCGFEESTGIGDALP